MTFVSDTTAPAHPNILNALGAANEGVEPSYGSDRWTALARERLQAVFECDLDIWLVASGTAANALALALICPPTGSVLCHQEAHIQADERGAPEFFSGGGRLSLLPGEHAKIAPDALGRRLAAMRPGNVHETLPAAVSVSNLTECGAAYSALELAEIGRHVHAAGLRMHLDGARFANALVGQPGASAADLSWRAGVDVLSFGATKNGALGCEAVILFGEARVLAWDLATRAKRGGHMPPKARFLGAQMAAYLDGGLWLDLARRANSSARALADVLQAHGARLAHPVDGNEVFVWLPEQAERRLSDAGVGFHHWPDGSCRFVCSWMVGSSDIDRVAAVLRG